MSTDICVALGERVKKLRKKRGWTQVEMAVELGLDTSYICNVEQGKHEICIRNMQVIARGFGISLSKLLSRIGG
jgi:transcriptional regulator with XRE-family HTH domain